MKKNLIIAIILLLLLFSTCSNPFFPDKPEKDKPGTAPTGTLPAAWLVEMVQITGGDFTIGSSLGRYADEASRDVTLGDFFIGKFEVTQEQYLLIMEDNPSRFKTAVGEEDASKLPVERVTWYDAVEFCNKLSAREGLTPVYTINGEYVTADWDANGYRLPTEAEWEYACRAGTTTEFNNNSDDMDEDTGWYAANSNETTHQVGLKSANAWELHDMHGNVWEWCWDRYGDNDNEINRVSRGGGWIYEAEYLRSAYRGVSTPDDKHEVLGFRIVRKGN